MLLCTNLSIYQIYQFIKFISANTSTKDTSFSPDSSLLFHYLNLLDILIRASDVVALS